MKKLLLMAAIALATIAQAQTEKVKVQLKHSIAASGMFVTAKDSSKGELNGELNYYIGGKDFQVGLGNDSCFYFPAYELVIDDLRDYRFYAEDMVHPNYAATSYVWEKFIAACIDEPSQQLMKEISVIVAAKNHRPFNPASEQHKKFLQTNLEKLKKLQEQHPYINFEEEKNYFAP